MRFSRAVVSKLILVLSTVFISGVSKAGIFDHFHTFQDVALTVGKLTSGKRSSTGGAATINGGVAYGVLGIYLGLGPAFFVPDKVEDQREWTKYVGGIALGGVTVRIPLKKGMIIAGNDFIFSFKSYQPMVGYLFRGETRHTGIFITATVGSSHDTYYALGVRMTISE